MITDQGGKAPGTVGVIPNQHTASPCGSRFVVFGKISNIPHGTVVDFVAQVDGIFQRIAVFTNGNPTGVHIAAKFHGIRFAARLIVNGRVIPQSDPFGYVGNLIANFMFMVDSGIRTQEGPSVIKHHSHLFFAGFQLCYVDSIGVFCTSS